MGKRVLVKVPATTANLGPGFDALGMALNRFNTLELAETGEPVCHVEITGEGADFLPRDRKNLVCQTIETFFERVGYHSCGWKLKMENCIPFKRGLGSSASAIVGGILAANAIAGKPCTLDQMLALAIEIEGHPDNVAAAFLGGVVMITGHEGKYYYASFCPPPGLAVYAVIPCFSLSTRAARRVLPEYVHMEDAVFNLGRVALLTNALRDGNWDLLSVAVQDRIHQPYRSPLIPGLDEVFQAGKKAGAYGVFLSGSGPTVIAFAPPAAAVGEAMREVFRSHGYDSEVWVLEPSKQGAYIIEEANHWVGEAL